MTIELGDGVPPALATVIEQALTRRLTKPRELRVVSQRDVIDLVESETKLGRLQTCTAEECASVLADVLAVPFVMTGSVVLDDHEEPVLLTRVLRRENRTFVIRETVALGPDFDSAKEATAALASRVHDAFVPSRPWIGPLACGLVGLAGVATGIGLRLDAGRHHERATDPTVVGRMVDAREGERAQTAAVIAMGAGLAAVVAGVVWWLVSAPGDGLLHAEER